MVLDESGKTLIHGESSKFIGVNMSNLKDAGGRLYIRETLEAKGKGKGRTSFLQSKGGAQVKRVLLWEFQEGLLFAWVMDEK
jgi:signal transduction histidine kinase